MSSNPVLDLAKELISKPSVTPEDAGCQTLMAGRLASLGFHCESMRFGEVDNLWAVRGGDNSQPLFVFAGHTDVVPSGPHDQWSSDPFEPEVRGDYLYGRGAADMKGSLAAMLLAVEEFVQTDAANQLRLGFLITSDEEGPAIDGTVRVIETLQQRGQHIDYCLVGEPSSSDTVGDTIKNGRRGSLSGRLIVNGIQGHIAYPQLARNPIHQAMPALAELSQTVWDQGDRYFQPSSFQISNLNAGTGAGNVIPGQLSCDFNFRFAPSLTQDDLQKKVHAVLDAHGLDYHLTWTLHGQPFITGAGTLLNTACEAIEAITGSAPEVSTAGGTSDGRFIAPSGAQVIELGPVNASIHKVDEHVRVQDLEVLQRIYVEILRRIAV